MNRLNSAVLFVLLLVLLVLLALVIVGRARRPRAPSRGEAQSHRSGATGSFGAQAAPAVAIAAVTGGLDRRRQRRMVGGTSKPVPAPEHSRELHPLGDALMRHARSLGPEHIVGVHPLDRDRYEPLAGHAVGGAKSTTKAAAKPPPPKKPWAEYATWEDLHHDEGALAAYFETRAAVLNNPDLDWGPVLAEIGPKLHEKFEYIGHVNLAPDGRTLRLTRLEVSPVEAGSLKSETAYASVPGELVEKFAAQPALFLIHTHPIDPIGSPLPSSADLSTCLYFSAVARFAAHAVISRYGVLAYGLDWIGYKSINEADDWQLAALNLSHDVVAAHEAIRSWSPYTLQEYLAFYPRHRLLLFSYPSPEMVGDMRRYTFVASLERPIDHAFIEEHYQDIVRHKDSLLKAPARQGTTEPPEAPKLGFD